MPYCDEHNEVYRAAECPVCAGSAGDDSEPADGVGVDDSGGSVGDIVDEALDTAADAEAAEGDSVVGSQEKHVERTDVTNIDNSTTEIDESVTDVDNSTTVTDSVVKDSDIGSPEGATEVDDSVVSDSTVGGGQEGAGPAEPVDATQFCAFCGEEFEAAAEFCPSCGEAVPE